jgi:hypothetical protein
MSNCVKLKLWFFFLSYRNLAVLRKSWKLMSMLVVPWVVLLLMRGHWLSMLVWRPKYFFYSCIVQLPFITCLFILVCVHSQNHRFSYGEPMTVESTTQAICDLALRFGEGEEESMVSIFAITIRTQHYHWSFWSTYLLLQSRPFGVSLLIAGHDENGPSL